MTELFVERTVTCPYCGELIAIGLDRSAGTQDFIEDCSVCCSPIEFHLNVDEDRQVLELTARGGDD